MIGRNGRIRRIGQRGGDAASTGAGVLSPPIWQNENRAIAGKGLPAGGV